MISLIWDEFGKRLRYLDSISADLLLNSLVKLDNFLLQSCSYELNCSIVAACSAIFNFDVFSSSLNFFSFADCYTYLTPVLER